MKRLNIAIVTCVCACVVAGGCGNKPETPEQTVMKAAKALQNNKPQVLFEMLPASYQQDIDSLISDAANRMDKEVWNSGKDLMNKIVKVAKTKKDILLQSRLLASNPNKDEVSKNWDQVVSMLDVVINSDFRDLAKLRHADVAKILTDSGTKILKKAKELQTPVSKEIAKLNTIKASLVSQDGDTAKVKIEAKGEEPVTFDFVRVEGKWIPKDLADDFAKKIKEARESLMKFDFMSKEGKALKAQLIKQFNMVSTGLAQVEKAKTKEEVDGALMAVMMSVMAAGMQR